ncbi:MAG TPA: hypothetical protein VHE55_17435 [Fimbriimonadaceae bacterium]|nr:hypothetical protein [Fimbriimonadaceae bacterium]
MSLDGIARAGGGVLVGRAWPRTSKGSTLVFVLVVAACASIALMALVSLAAQMNSTMMRVEQQARADMAMQGAVAAIRFQANSGALGVPSTQTIMIDNFGCTTTVTDNGANIANSYKVDISTNRWGNTYTLSRVTGLPAGSAASSLYKYAVAFNAACSMSNQLDTHDTGHKASLYSNGTLHLSQSGCSIDGDADLTTPTSGSYLSVTGSKATNAAARSWPTTSTTNYQNAADYSFGNHSVGNISFPSSHCLVVVNGDMTFNGGTISGTGTYYVTGNVTISGDLSYSNSSAMIAIICRGTVTVSDYTDVVGIVFTDGISWGNNDHITKGLLCLDNATSFYRSLDVTYDSRIRDGGGLGKSMHLPGLWP